MLGLIYLRTDINQQGVMNVNGVLFLFLMNTVMTNVMGVANVSITTYFIIGWTLNLLRNHYLLAAAKEKTCK